VAYCSRGSCSNL